MNLDVETLKNELNTFKAKVLDFKKRHPYILIGIIILGILIFGEFLLILIPLVLMVLGGMYLWEIFSKNN